MGSKVFVSSTVYDLLDVRAELGQDIRDMGMEPLLSDSGTSEFVVQPKEDSIETCLSNVRMCDFFLLILSRRYGPSLLKTGYDDISATHLEYREAIAYGIPVFFYVRDRLEAEYHIWVKNKKRDTLSFNWVAGKNDFRLFKFIDEHQKLEKSTERSNWFQSFRNSVDLKAFVRKDLRIPAAELSLEKAILDNAIPLFRGEQDVSPYDAGGFTQKAEYTFTNMGNGVAFNVSARWDEEADVDIPTPVLAPSCTITRTVLIKTTRLPWENVLHIKYQTVQGHWIHDRFKLKLEKTSLGIFHQISYMDRKYRVGGEKPFIFEVAED